MPQTMKTQGVTVLELSIAKSFANGLGGCGGGGVVKPASVVHQFHTRPVRFSYEQTPTCCLCE